VLGGQTALNGTGIVIARLANTGKRIEGPTRTGVFNRAKGVSNMDTNTPYLGRVAEDRTDWVSKARCLHSTDPDELFVRGKAQRKATAICRQCPVVVECLAEALDDRVEFGVWGGMTERQRRAVLKEHPEVVSWSEFLAAQRKQRNTG
jgi:WhiB family redox-sensing transcriptional regulator